MYSRHAIPAAETFGNFTNDVLDMCTARSSAIAGEVAFLCGTFPPPSSH